MRPRAITRDLDWGVTIPLDGWRDRPFKKFYVWFDAVIGYFSASVEWARRSGDAGRLAARGGHDPDARQVYFMGKDNITFHAQIWPALLLGHNGPGDHGGEPGRYGALEPPDRDRVQRVPDDERVEVLHVARHRHLRRTTSCASSARTRCGTSSRWPARRPRTPTSPGTSSSGGPTSSWPTSGATWSTGRSRWRTRTSVRSRHPAATDADAELLALSAAASTTVGDLLARSGSRRPSARRCGSSARPTSTCPIRSRGSSSDDRSGAATVLHTALQVVDDANTLLTPFLPHSAQQIFDALGGAGVWAAQPEIREVTDLDDVEGAGPGRYPVSPATTPPSRPAGRHADRGGRPLAKPTPLFAKLDPELGETGPGVARPPGRRAIRPGCPGAPTSEAAADGRAPPEPLPVPVVDAHTHLDACGCVTAAEVEAAMAGRRRSACRGGHRRRRPGLRALGRRGRHWARPVCAAVALHPTRAGRSTAAKAPKSSGWPPAPGWWPSVRPVSTTTGTHSPHDAQAGARSAGTSSSPSALGKPLMIHDRVAHDDVLAVLDERGRAGDGGVPLLLRRRRDGPRRASTPGTCCPSPARSLFRNAAPRGGRAACARRTSYWSRPTPRFSPRTRFRGGRTSRTACRGPSAGWPRSALSPPSGWPPAPGGPRRRCSASGAAAAAARPSPGAATSRST